MQDWLSTNQIAYDRKLTKVGLYKLIKINKGPSVYTIDNILNSKDHIVVRLPPYHCDLNPLELIWSQIKGKVARENNTFTVNAILDETKSAIAAVTKEDWKKCCKHVEQIEAA